MFDSTLPVGDPELMRVSAFQRYVQDTAQGERDSRLSSLNPSLLEDLQRFDRRGMAPDDLDLLDVVAAALRHRRNLRVHLQCDARVIPLTLHAEARLVHCPLPQEQLLGLRLGELSVLQVEPAGGPGAEFAPGDDDPALTAPIGLLVWELALRGARAALLPEIAGLAAYRIVPGTDLAALRLSGSLLAAVTRLRRETTNLHAIAGWPGFDHERAERMLNGLYLLSALIVTRTHPAATHDG